MAGHSKWANIRYRKNTQDARKGKIFTKLIREITVAARSGGTDESTNARLRDVITKALKANMKRDTIDQAIKRGIGDAASDAMQNMRYEGYGPGGVALLVECLSDNKNRTVSEIRHILTKYHGHLGTDGSVAYLFQDIGEILLAPSVKEETVMELAIDAGASDIAAEDGQVLITTPPAQYHHLLSLLEEKQFPIEHAERSKQAVNLIPLDLETEKAVLKLIDALEDLDDVQAVYTNAALHGSGTES